MADSQARVHGQLFPDGKPLPRLLAGPREPVTSASLLGLTENPNEFGNGVEAEVSLGHALSVFAFSGGGPADGVLVGMEAGVFARFGLQVLERELIASDWMFAVPVVWLRDGGWIRFRYYHSSSHLGDEYSRRFDDRGEDFSRDAMELIGLVQIHPRLGLYGGVRFAHNVKPEESRRWVLRGGVQWEASDRGGVFQPLLAADVEWDEDAGPDPRLELKVGAWLPPVNGRRSVQLALGSLTGPSPLGQFQGEPATQVFLGLFGYF